MQDYKAYLSIECNDQSVLALFTLDDINLHKQLWVRLCQQD